MNQKKPRQKLDQSKPISRALKHIIIGMLLGDANVQTSQAQGPVTKARLRVIHSLKQHAYLQHKFELLKPWSRQKKITLLTEQRDQDKIYKKGAFNTLTLKCFAFYFHLFYQRDLQSGQVVKRVPKWIHRYLSPLCLAYWYMDDGSLKWKNRSKAVRLCTDGFSKPDVQRLVTALNNQYHLGARLFRARSRFRIYIPNTHETFTKLIEPHVHWSLKHKLPSAQEED